MAYECATVGAGVFVAPSSIRGSGNGLFTARPFARNDLITEYEGEVVDRAAALEMRASATDTHVRALNSQFQYIAGLTAPADGRGGASFANDARDARKNNAIFICRFDRVLGRDRVFLQAKHDIAPGTEVFASYGSGYWANSSRPPKAAPREQKQLRRLPVLRAVPLHRQKPPRSQRLQEKVARQQQGQPGAPSKQERRCKQERPSYREMLLGLGGKEDGDDTAAAASSTSSRSGRGRRSRQSAPRSRPSSGRSARRSRPRDRRNRRSSTQSSSSSTSSRISRVGSAEAADGGSSAVGVRSRSRSGRLRSRPVWQTAEFELEFE